MSGELSVRDPVTGVFCALAKDAQFIESPSVSSRIAN
jgi:hypothetical protein